VEAAKILLVDDDSTMLGVVGAILNRHRHKVLSARSPREALEIVGRGELVDVVVSDFYMPELNGGELIREIVRFSPSTMGIVMTAGTVTAAEVPPCVPVLKKPIRTPDLLATVDMMVMHSAQLRACLHEAVELAAQSRERSRQLLDELAVLRERWLRKMKAAGQ
jgi:CheY-like chemotaxis protein